MNVTELTGKLGSIIRRWALLQAYEVCVIGPGGNVEPVSGFIEDHEHRRLIIAGLTAEMREKRALPESYRYCIYCSKDDAFEALQTAEDGTHHYHESCAERFSEKERSRYERY